MRALLFFNYNFDAERRQCKNSPLSGWGCRLNKGKKFFRVIMCEQDIKNKRKVVVSVWAVLPQKYFLLNEVAYPLISYFNGKSKVFTVFVLYQAGENNLCGEAKLNKRF